jgi:hypothetical protein
MSARRICLLLVASACLAVPKAYAFGPFDDLLMRIPPNANALLLIDSKQIQESPYGIKKRLAQKRESDYLSGATQIPPSTQLMLVAAQFNPGSLNPTWEATILKFKQPKSIEDLLQAEGGTLDQIGSQTVLLSSRNTYVVRFGEKIAGIMRPPNRQETARWIRAGKNIVGSPISDYLQKAANSVGPGHPLVMAIDLSDIFDQEGVYERLKRAKGLQDSNVDLKKLAKVISGIQGLRFSATASADDAIVGEVRIDFSDPVAPYDSIAKKLVLGAFTAAGAHVEDMDDWQTTTDGQAIVMNGPISEQGLRQFLSPLLRPSSSIQDVSSDIQESSDPKVVASQRYFRSISKLLDELQAQKAKTLQHIAYLMYKYAQTVDELPLLNVDPDLLKFGGEVSNILRMMAGAATGTVTASQLTQALTTQGWSTYGGYGYSGPYGAGYVPGGAYYSSNAYAVASSVAQGQASELQARLQGFQKINSDRTAIRRMLIAKYNAEF